MLGVPAYAVLAFEILLTGAAMFNHGNIYLPLRIDRILWLALVPPGMNQVHHSVRVEETNSNYGFNLPWWDRIFGTYRDQPVEGQLGLKIGLAQFRELTYLNLIRLLKMPFN